MAAAAAAPALGLGSGPAERVILDDLDTVYAGAGLIAAAMGPSDPFYEAVMDFFDASEEAGVTVFVSYLTLMEVVDVVRKRAKMRHKCRDGSWRELEEANAAAAAAVAKIVRFVGKWRARKVVRILNGESAADLNFEHLLIKMFEHQGRTPRARKGGSYRHEGIGPIDLIHIALAHLAGASAMCTTDMALAQIKDDPLYARVKVVTLLPRPAAAKKRKRGSRRR